MMNTLPRLEYLHSNYKLDRTDQKHQSGFANELSPFRDSSHYDYRNSNYDFYDYYNPAADLRPASVQYSLTGSARHSRGAKGWPSSLTGPTDTGPLNPKSDSLYSTDFFPTGTQGLFKAYTPFSPSSAPLVERETERGEHISTEIKLGSTKFQSHIDSDPSMQFLEQRPNPPDASRRADASENNNPIMALPLPGVQKPGAMHEPYPGKGPRDSLPAADSPPPLDMDYSYTDQSVSDPIAGISNWGRPGPPSPTRVSANGSSSPERNNSSSHSRPSPDRRSGQVRLPASAYARHYPGGRSTNSLSNGPPVAPSAVSALGAPYAHSNRSSRSFVAGDRTSLRNSTANLRHSALLDPRSGPLEDGLVMDFHDRSLMQEAPHIGNAPNGSASFTSNTNASYNSAGKSKSALYIAAAPAGAAIGTATTTPRTGPNPTSASSAPAANPEMSPLSPHHNAQITPATRSPAIGTTPSATSARSANETAGLYSGGGGGGSPGPSNEPPSEFMQKHKKSKKRTKLWIILLLVLLVLVGLGVGLGIGIPKILDKNKDSSGLSADEDAAKNGDLTKDSSEIKKLLNNPNLHKVFPGVDYTPINAQFPDCLRTPPSQNNVTRDIAVISQLTNRVRLYGNDCDQTEMVLTAIDRLGLSHDANGGMSVWLGVWLDNNSTTNDRQMGKMWDILEEHGTKPFSGVVIGNEILFREEMSEYELATTLKEARKDLDAKGYKDLKLASSDLGSNWSKDLTDSVDVVMSNVHPFFGGGPVEEAAGWTWNFWQMVDVAIDPTKEHSISEVGWPTAGGNNCGPGNKCTSKTVGSVAGIDEMNVFMESWVCQALKNGTDYFWFEAFDEPWKSRYNTKDEAWEDKWGLMDVNRNLKSGVKIPDCDGASVKD